ncbi:c-type cytochrome biogenesis protein CcsB [Tersicoccus solisilvae]|uniref:C-type cytochrome biogenesis protein CcsB n=1 Tax=Tersicoccus solisilvae TaxID=1882339 RepID=A0ABQ1NQY4_9MICC|nr:c-type cytochrome biogenesis protein CcsB [Tersicoccus solisilvae]
MGINETLGQYSELFMLSAAFVYLVAFVAFAWDMASSSTTLRAIDARAAEAAVTQRSRERAPAMAGGGAGERPVNPAGTGPDGQVQTDTVPRDDLRYGAGRRRAARIGVALTTLAVLIHAAAVISRGVAAARVPWGNMYEFCTTGALIVAAVFLLSLIRRDLRFLGTFVIGLVLIMLCAATIAFRTPVAHLIPALQSYWLVIHVSVAVFSSALFTLSFCMSVLQLLQARREAAIAAGRTPRLSVLLGRVPSALTLENGAYRINAVGFVFWTFTLMAGAIWAEHAWGRYWGWDPKEVWTFVIWTVYAGYLHARATRGWTGTRAAWLSIVGYLCVIVNFTVVNTVFAGLHSYSGL